ncbi:FadR family transcriptional regulator [Alteromonas aestuariivivens]|uniref:FadR family transcriptional regulator n=1 Tax=Alteromonas aestuariivivens TaxID=1938339 RepID=A0A3D8ME47_9ALTE|nr:FadR/GntR family transcriptional regulator [Alteromonas aestuariivivens]RDV29012.1 FadR family transcriptional regulator [Alteromonas aestuariivivens]
MLGPTTLNITHNLTNTLGLAIVRGEYAGALPSEADLCHQYGVSRSSTREAVKMLSAKGLIQSRPKQGIRIQEERYWNMFDGDVLKWILVSKPTLELLKEFLDVRVVIEPQAAALATKNGNEEAIAGIRRALIRLNEADVGLDDPLEAEVEFHTAILDASGNRFLAQFSDFVGTALRVTQRYTSKIRGGLELNLKQAQTVYEAIASGDAKTAEAAMRSQLSELIDLLNG